MRHGRARGARYRHVDGPWRVRARVERFAEPAVLLLLRDRPAHGYELLDRLGGLLPSDGIDMGNLYRLLRALEDDGLVRSEWDASVLRKLSALESVYEKMNDDRANRRMEALEWIIIALIAFEIAFSLLSGPWSR